MRHSFLLSIKPTYSERIFAGSKRYELRKRKLGAKRGDVVLVYTSSPTQALTGAFMVLGELELPVDVMWNRHESHLGIEHDDYVHYYGDAPKAVAIAIGRTVRIPPISLTELRRAHPGFSPPQSFMHCPEVIADHIPSQAWTVLLAATPHARAHVAA